MTEQSMSAPPSFLPIPGEPSIPWKRWKNIFFTYLLVIGGDKYGPLRKQAKLLHHLGVEGRRMYDDLSEISLGMGNGQPMNFYDMSLQMLEKHFTPKVNVVFERHTFFSRVQNQDEDIMTYVAYLHGLAVTCEFQGLFDSLIRDKIVRCTNIKKVTEKLLSKDPTLEEAIQIARSMENTAVWMKEIDKGKSPSASAVITIGKEVLAEVKEVKREVVKKPVNKNSEYVAVKVGDNP
ncbi:uncharacterized protein LOC144784049 [Lissotriton helveticus]